MSSGSRGRGAAAPPERRRDPGRAFRALGRRLFRRKRRLVYFHRVDSPPSYLLAQALERFLAEHPVELELVVVPAPAADFDPEPLLRARYDLRDARALAPLYGLSFPATDELPHEARVRMANAVLLVDRPPMEQLGLAIRLSAALFGHDGDGLHRLTEERGTASGQEVRPKLEAAYKRLRSEGHYEDASISFEGEWYVGVDRLYHLEEKIRAENEAAGQPLFGGPTLPAPERAEVRVPVETYFSFRSPHSYVGLARLAQLSRSYPIEIVPKPVLPLLMRGVSVPPAKLRYVAFDASREARRHGLPFGHLRRPIGDDVERCLALAYAASREGRGLELALALTGAIWSEGLDVRDDPHLLAVATRAGLTEASARAAFGDRSYRSWVDGHLDALVELGLWSAPSFVVGDRAFFGQDRIPLVLEEAQRLLRASRGPLEQVESSSDIEDL